MWHPTVLLFDLGGVLVENTGFEHLNDLLSAPMQAEELKSRWLASAAVRSFEAGACSAGIFADEMVAEWQLPVSPGAFLEAFASWPKGLYPGAEELLSHLRGRYTLACLSNSNAVHWERFDGFGDYFQIALSSHVIGEVKPDAVCFSKALQECNARASEVAFFDDSLINVAAARAIGIQSFHVNGLTELRNTLVEKGWL